jgi:nitrogen fixation NifU-like protein
MPYSSLVLQYFYARKGLGDVQDPDGIGEASSERIYIRIAIRVSEDHIVEVKYRCPTCVVAIAACSALADRVENLTLEEAAHVSPDELSAMLGGIPKERYDRCILAVDALKRAINNYKVNRKD